MVVPGGWAVSFERGSPVSLDEAFTKLDGPKPQSLKQEVSLDESFPYIAHCMEARSAKGS